MLDKAKLAGIKREWQHAAWGDDVRWLIEQLETTNTELTTLRFWREQNLHEIKHGREEIRGLRERLVANERS